MMTSCLRYSHINLTRQGLGLCPNAPPGNEIVAQALLFVSELRLPVSPTGARQALLPKGFPVAFGNLRAHTRYFSSQFHVLKTRSFQTLSNPLYSIRAQRTSRAHAFCAQTPRAKNEPQVLPCGPPCRLDHQLMRMVLFSSSFGCSTFLGMASLSTPSSNAALTSSRLTCSPT